MHKLITTAAIALLAFTTATVQAKDKDKHKKKHHDDHGKSTYYQSGHYRGSNSKARIVNSRDSRYYDGRDYGDNHREHDRTRTVYVIQNDRPVRQVVYIDASGRYYRQAGGRPVYIGNRYFESYPSRYYTSSGQRRINISLPF